MDGSRRGSQVENGSENHRTGGGSLRGCRVIGREPNSMVDASYEIAGQTVLRAFREEGCVRAIYVRRSVATGDWCPGLSDLDIAIVVDNLVMSESVDMVLELSRRYVDIGSRFPFLGEVEFYTPHELVKGRETGYDTYRRYEAKKTWRVLYGRGDRYLQELCKPVREDLERSMVFEILVWWRFFNSLMFTGRGENKRWVGYQLYKFTCDIFKLSLNILDPNTPLMFSRHRAVNHLKNRYRDLDKDQGGSIGISEKTGGMIGETARYLAWLRDHSYIDVDLEAREQSCYKTCYRLVDLVMQRENHLFQVESGSIYGYPSERIGILDQRETRRTGRELDKSLYTQATCSSVFTVTSPFCDHEMVTVLVPKKGFWDTDWYRDTLQKLREAKPGDGGELRRHFFEILPASCGRLIGSIWLHNETTRLQKPSRNKVDQQPTLERGVGTITMDMIANLDNYQQHMVNRTRTLYTRSRRDTASFMKAFWEIAAYHALHRQRQRYQDEGVAAREPCIVVPTTTREVTQLYRAEPVLKELHPPMERVAGLYQDGIASRGVRDREIKETGIKIARAMLEGKPL